ncbi:MAG: UPF0182 family protein [Anaerolineae bacterium]|jgi:hypothetical protein
MFRNRGCTVVIVVLGLFVVAFFALVDLYTDWTWFSALGITSVLWKRIVTEWLLFLGAWLIASVVLAANWWLARALMGGGQLTVPWLEQQQVQNQYTAAPTTRVISGRIANGVLALLAVGIGLFFAFPVRGMWLSALFSWNAVPFGQTDPILNRDLSFYIFRLPWLQFLQGWLLWLFAVSLGGSALIYIASHSAEQLTNKIRVVGERPSWFRFSPSATRHLLVLGAIALLLIAWGYQLRIPELLYSDTGAAYGASYADVHARLPVLNILTGIAILGAILLLVSMFVKLRWLPYAVVGAWLVVAFVGTNIYPALLQRVVVEPNELAREQEYIQHTIQFTRQAFDLTKVVEDDFDVAEVTQPLDLEANQDTMKNIRLWDYRPLLRTYGQLQEIRLYYEFSDVDIDRYQLGDDYRQVTLSVREIASDELPQTAQTWVNRHLVYTHGSGVVLSPVNEVVEEGLPNLWVRDIPPQSRYPELELTRPEIYYGELTNDYVIARTEEQELDYPSGDQNVYTTYAGEGGIRIDSLLKRLAYSIRLGSSQIALSSAITPESRLMWRRSIDERVQTIAPFLRYDPDPYAVILDGRLVWLLDAYTVTDRHPYSEPIRTTFGEINYIRNSIKITMDAYNGRLNFYLIDPSDPLAQVYQAIFPDLFRSVDEMDPALVAHWRYPEGLFRIQASKLRIFHMTEAQVFYNQEDLWNWAEEVVTGERMPIEPYYVNMRLPGETDTEFVLMLPFTPSTKQNMVAWLYARNDGENYGQLGVYKFAKQRLIYGPMQVESRIDQDPVISQQLSLWNQRGSQVIRGNLLVIPVDQAILYVEPIYLQAEASQLPELRRVIVAYGNRIVMEETLAEGLARVMATEPVSDEPIADEPDSPETPPAVLEEDVEALILQADTYYRTAQECLLNGDWSCYGQEMDALEEVLEALVVSTQE